MNFSTTVHGVGSEGGSGTRELYMEKVCDDLSRSETLEQRFQNKL